MSILEDKLEEIEAKITRLIEQNAQYKRICEDLLATRRQLEKDNRALDNMLDRIAVELDTVTTNTALISDALAENSADGKEKISNCIQNITNSINRLQ